MGTNRYMLLVQELNAELRWGLSAEQCADYAQNLDALNEPGVAPYTVLRYHADHAFVQALRAELRPDHASAVAALTSYVQRIVRSKRYRWEQDNALSEDDVTQIVLMRVLEKLETFKYRSAFLTWMTQLALNEIRQVCRKRQARSRSAVVERLEHDTTIADAAEPVIDIIVDRMIRAEFKEYLHSLPDQRLAQIWQLYVEQHMTLKEIGAHLYCSISRVHNLLAIIRSLFAQFDARGSADAP